MRDVRILIQRAREAGLLDRLRIRMGLPLEFYLQAVHPVVETYAAHLHQRARSQCNSTDQPDRLLMDGLELAGFALAFRQGRILPMYAAPEEIGERAHRWTYAVFLTALLHPGLSPCSGSRLSGSSLKEGAMSPSNLLVDFERIVPGSVLDWLCADTGLRAELHAFLLGSESGEQSTIGRLIKQAQEEFSRIRGHSCAGSGSECGCLLYTSPSPRD